MKPINLNSPRTDSCRGMSSSFHKDAVKCELECSVVNIHNASYFPEPKGEAMKVRQCHVCYSSRTTTLISKMIKGHKIDVIYLVRWLTLWTGGTGS